MTGAKLDVYLEAFAEPIGGLEGAEDYALSFHYRPGYLERNDALPLSLRMPLRANAYGDYACRAFFQNLLFEGHRLDQVADREGLDRRNVAGLLSHVGQECPGAVSIVPEGQPPGKRPGVIPDDYREIPPDDLAREVSALYQGRSPSRSRRFSLAGVQGKLAVTVDDAGRIYESRDPLGAPTTHILKVGSPEHDDLVENEYICLQLARRLGLAVAASEIRTAGKVKYLLVRRYDRERADHEVHRLHQEDACQALGLPPALKYEADGSEARRTSLAGLFGLADGTTSPIAARRSLIAVTLFNYLIANFDAHAKNFALLYKRAAPTLAPFYDLVSVGVYPDMKPAFALFIGGAQDFEAIGRAQWDAFLQDAGITAQRQRRGIAESVMKPIAQRILPALDDLLAEEALVHRGRRIRNQIGAGLRNLNEAFGWDIPVDTDAPVTAAPGWRLS